MSNVMWYMIEMIIFNNNAMMEINNTIARGENLKSRNSDSDISINLNLDWILKIKSDPRSEEKAETVQAFDNNWKKFI